MSDPAAAPATPATPPTPAANWYDGADADTIGYLQNRGLDKKPANEAAFAAIKAHRAAEAHLGTPADQLVRLPKDAADEAGRKALHAKLGVPQDAKGYDYTGLKYADGTELDQAFRDTLSETFLQRGVPKDAAPEIVKSVVKYLDDKKAGEATIAQGKMATEADDLAKSWGTNMKANTFIANQAAEKLGLGKDILDILSKTAGRPAVANALLKIGQMMGEDKFVNTPAGGTPGIMTKEQATARMKELMSDTAWAARLDAGDARTRQEFDSLTRLQVG